MKIDTLTVDSAFGLSLPQPLYRPDNAAESLMILLPGRGYTVHHPALAYMAYMGVEERYDVLGVQYGFQLGDGSFSMEQMPLLQQDIDNTLAAVDLDSYGKIAIVGKSLGTPLAVNLAHKITTHALILLTPIPLALGVDSPVRTLAIIGTADPFYSQELVDSHKRIQWKVYEDLNHGFLKAGEWQASLGALENIIYTCAQFLREDPT